MEKIISNRAVKVRRIDENSGSEWYRLNVVAECAEKVYEFRVEFRNGTPCGFNSNQCVVMMTPNGWANIADSNKIGANVPNDYVCLKQPQYLAKAKENARGVVNALANYIADLNK